MSYILYKISNVVSEIFCLVFKMYILINQIPFIIICLIRYVKYCIRCLIFSPYLRYVIYHIFSLYQIIFFVKDCLPYLFPGFRNKYFNKISLDNMLYFQNKLYKF